MTPGSVPAGARHDAALRICATLRAAGYRALLAGGCVRDMLLGVAPKDYDVATDAGPDAVKALFDHVISVGAAFGVQLVVLPEGHFEVATFRKDGPYLDGRRPSEVSFCDEETDAQRRDFTINALFFDPVTNEVVDYACGQDDLRAGILRAVGEPAARFEEDRLRLLRAIRLAARLGFRIEPVTLEAIRAMAPTVLSTSAERIRDELLKMLTEGQARRAFELLDETGLLEAVLPEVAAMKGVEQPPEFHPEGDVWTHTLMLLERLENPSPTLALAALLHDVGKPVTQTFEDRIRFHGHDAVGADMARAICRRLRMSREETERVEWLVKQHMRWVHTPDMRTSKRKRFMREEGFPELLELARLDCEASHRDTRLVETIKRDLDALGPEEIRPAPILNGRDLMAMGYPAGPLLGTILSALEDAQLEGEVTTAAEAVAWLEAGWPLDRIQPGGHSKD